MIKIILLLLKNSNMFVVRINFKSNDAPSTNITETEKGRRKGESPPVVSVHRMELVRNDLPPVFNQNSFIMRTKDNGKDYPFSPTAIMAQQIVEGLLRANELPTMRQHLREMVYTYLLEEDESLYRRQVFETYMAIDIMLKKVEMLASKEKLNALLINQGKEASHVTS